MTPGDGGKPVDADEFYERAAAALERAAIAAEDRTHSIDNAAHEISLALEVIDDVLPSLPTREEVDAGRRLTVIRVVFAAVWLVVASMLVVDEHVESCSPGARANRVVRLLLADDVSLRGLRAAARQPTPAWCDAVMPTHAHAPLDEWPTAPNVLGMTLYAALAAATGAAVRPRGKGKRAGSTDDSARRRLRRSGGAAVRSGDGVPREPGARSVERRQDGRRGSARRARDPGRVHDDESRSARRSARVDTDDAEQGRDRRGASAVRGTDGTAAERERDEHGPAAGADR